MTDDADWVLLVECATMAELHLLRATLEARGVPCRLQGEHTHGVLGPIQSAAAMRSRVLVPRRALPVARALAEDIMGPFDERPELDEDEDGEASPFRTAAELVPDDEPDEDEALASEQPDAVAERRGPALRPRSYAVLMLIVLMGGAFLGLAHLYVRRNVRAGILATVGVFSIAAMTRGAAWAPIVLAVGWVLDLVGGLDGVHEDQRRHAALAPAPAPPSA